MKQAVLALIFTDDSKSVLLVQRRDVPVWVLPGGGVDLGESLEEAVLREVEEETGLKCAIDQKLAHYLPINRLTGEAHLFKCQKTSGQIQATEETRAVQYFPLDALPKTFFYIHKAMLQEALEEKSRPATYPLTQVTWGAFFAYLLRHPIITCRFLLSKAGLPLNHG